MSLCVKETEFVFVFHCHGTGVSAAFAVKLFKSWINERDINSVATSLRKVGMDNRLMVNALGHSVAAPHDSLSVTDGL